MTRETKIGVGIVSVFLCLVGVVVASKLRKPDTPPENPNQQVAQNGNGTDPAKHHTPDEHSRGPGEPSEQHDAKGQNPPPPAPVPAPNEQIKPVSSLEPILPPSPVPAPAVTPPSPLPALPMVPMVDPNAPAPDPTQLLLAQIEKQAREEKGSAPKSPTPPPVPTPLVPPVVPPPLDPPAGPAPLDPKQEAKKPEQKGVDTKVPAPIAPLVPLVEDKKPAPPEKKEPTPPGPTPLVPPVVPPPLDPKQGDTKPDPKAVDPKGPAPIAPLVPLVEDKKPAPHEKKEPTPPLPPPLVPPVDPKTPVPTIGGDPKATVPTLPTPMDLITKPNPMIGALKDGDVPRPIHSTDQTHKVLATETSFAAVSRTLYGDEKYARALLQYNREHPIAAARFEKDPPLLQSGMEVLYPDQKTLEQKFGQFITAPTAAAPTAALPPVRISTPLPVANTPTADKTEDFRLTAPKLIFEVAREKLGDGTRWGEIWRLNPTIDTAAQIPAGTVLRLPAKR